jgi:hypothetical protein
MIYLNNVENAAAPGPLVQDNFEELEITNTFERSPSKSNGVATVNYGPPAGSAVQGRLWTDVGRNQWLCVVGGATPTWRRISAWPGMISLSAGTLAIDWHLGRFFEKTIAADSTFTFSNVLEEEEIVFLVRRSAVAAPIFQPLRYQVGG